VNDGSASKPSAPIGARHTVDEPSNPLFYPAVMADSSRQATYLIVAPAPAAVCPRVVVTRQSQSLFKDGTDQNAVRVRIKKAGSRYIFCSDAIRFRLMSTQYLHYVRPAFTRRRAQMFKPIASVAAVTVSGATSKEPPKVSVPRVT